MDIAPHPTTTPAAPRTAAGPSELRAVLDRHVREARAGGLDDDQIRRSLVTAGWRQSDVDLALARGRSHGGSFGYTWLFFSLGFAGLAAAGSGHVLLDGLKSQADRSALVGWLTVLFCSAPFAVAAVRWATEAERKDPRIRRNPLRHTLGMTLLWLCGIIGMARLVQFVAKFFSAVVDPASNPTADPLASFLQVVVTVAMAGGVFWWTWSFLHEDDDVRA